MKKYKKECLWILVLLVLFLVLTYLVITLKTSKIDEEAFNLLIRLKCKPVTSILYVITEIGSSIGVIMVLLISLIPFIKTKKLSDFKYVLINTMLGVLLMKGIKEIVRNRIENGILDELMNDNKNISIDMSKDKACINN